MSAIVTIPNSATHLKLVIYSISKKERMNEKEERKGKWRGEEGRKSTLFKIFNS